MRRLHYRYSFFFNFLIFLLLANNSYSQAKRKETARFTLYGKIVLDEKPVENVSIEILRNGQFLRKMLTTKNGKYSFSMNQDTLNQKNEYTIHITKDGTVPKTIIVNTFIPAEQYDEIPYEYNLEITLLTTTINEVIIQRPSAKIKWINIDDGFGIDKVYAKIVQKEEEKLKEDPDKYLKELAQKNKQEEEERLKKQAEEEQKKADELARKTAEEEKKTEQKSTEEVEERLKENVIAITTEIKKLAKQESDSAEVTNVPEKAIEVKKPVSGKEEVYDNSKEYELKKARIQLIKAKEAAEKKKRANLSKKYETQNVMSSLLDAVDEHNKKIKNK
jgi:hypothetical protein